MVELPFLSTLSYSLRDDDYTKKEKLIPASWFLKTILNFEPTPHRINVMAYLTTAVASVSYGDRSPTISHAFYGDSYVRSSVINFNNHYLKNIIPTAFKLINVQWGTVCD